MAAGAAFVGGALDLAGHLVNARLRNSEGRALPALLFGFRAQQVPAGQPRAYLAPSPLDVWRGGRRPVASIGARRSWGPARSGPLWSARPDRPLPSLLMSPLRPLPAMAMGPATAASGWARRQLPSRMGEDGASGSATSCRARLSRRLPRPRCIHASFGLRSRMAPFREIGIRA